MMSSTSQKLPLQGANRKSTFYCQMLAAQSVYKILHRMLAGFSLNQLMH